MKKTLYLFLAAIAVLISACKTDISDGKKQTLYVVSTDSTVLVWVHNANAPIVLRKPILYQEVKKYNLPYNAINLASRNNTGMERYIDGQENDTDGIAWGRTILLVCIIFAIVYLAAVVTDL